jgi:hypothetical protein
VQKLIDLKYNKTNNKIMSRLCAVLWLLSLSLFVHAQVPNRQELHAFADTLASRGILYGDSLSIVRTRIDQGYIKSGTIDFLPYCKNANIFSLPAYTKAYPDPKKYLVAIYNDLVKMIPGFHSPEIEVYAHFFDRSACSQIRGVMTEEVPVDQILPTNKWQLRVPEKKTDKAAGYINDYGICITSEWELVRMINGLLKDRKIPYQLAWVDHNISDAQQHMISGDSIFGIICLSRTQGYRFPDENPMLGLYTSFQGYITKPNIELAIQEYQSIGLFGHLGQQEIEGSRERSLSAPYTNFNDILALFPGVVYQTKRFSINDYRSITKQLALISHQQFNPIEPRLILPLKDSGSKCISFSLNGKTYKTDPMGEGDWAYYTYLKFINRVLDQSKIDGQFALLYNTKEDKEQGIHSSFIYLTKEQATFLKRENLISIIPDFYVEFESWDSFVNNVEKSWEAFY